MNKEFLVPEIVHDKLIGKSGHEAIAFELYININVIDNANIYQCNLEKGRYNVM